MKRQTIFLAMFGALLLVAVPAVLAQSDPAASLTGTQVRKNGRARREGGPPRWTT